MAGKALSVSEHQARHQELHQALDELLADWASHHPGRRITTLTCEELMGWSCDQQHRPTERSGPDDHA